MKKTTKDKLTNVLVRLYKSGLTVDDVSTMSDSDLRKAIGFKGKNLDAFRRNVKSLVLNDTRKKALLHTAKQKFSKEGYRGKGLNRVEKEIETIIKLPKPKKEIEIVVPSKLTDIIQNQSTLKEYEYGQIEIQTKTGTYYIRYNTDTDIVNAFNRLADSVDINDAVIFNSYFPYTEYIDDSFQERLNEWLGL